MSSWVPGPAHSGGASPAPAAAGPDRVTSSSPPPALPPPLQPDRAGAAPSPLPSTGATPSPTARPRRRYPLFCSPTAPPSPASRRTPLLLLAERNATAHHRLTEPPPGRLDRVAGGERKRASGRICSFSHRGCGRRRRAAGWHRARGPNLTLAPPSHTRCI
ncbi:unnamed protein product [Urochloa humidicola]